MKRHSETYHLATIYTRSSLGLKRYRFALVNAMHITASVFINDDESGLHHDYEVWLEKLAPEKPYS